MSDKENDVAIEEEVKEDQSDIATSQIADIALINDADLNSKIHEIRGQQVMLDFELAEIYGYSTKAFNQQVRRNIEKFDGDDFMFQLSDEEWDILRSQFVTASRRNERYAPYAFTEQGVYMLMTVLKGDLATRQSKALIRLFKRMKDRIVEAQGLVTQREFLQLYSQTLDNTKAIGDMNLLLTDQQRLLREYDAKLSDVLVQMNDTVKKSEISPVLLQFESEEQNEFLLLDGHPVHADVTYMDIYGKAKKSVYIIDNYINLKTLRLLQGIQQCIEVIVFSDNQCNYLHASDYADFQIEFPTIPITFRTTASRVHDRYIILDYEEADERIFLCGSSSKDAGVAKMSTIVEMQSEDFKTYLHTVIEQLKLNPPLVLR